MSSPETIENLQLSDLNLLREDSSYIFDVDCDELEECAQLETNLEASRAILVDKLWNLGQA